MSKIIFSQMFKIFIFVRKLQGDLQVCNRFINAFHSKSDKMLKTYSMSRQMFKIMQM